MRHAKMYALVGAAALIAPIFFAVAPHRSVNTSEATARQQACATASKGTPLGVNVSSAFQLKRETAKFGPLPIIRVYYTGMPDPHAWSTGAPQLSHSAVVLSFRSPPAKVLSGADDAALRHFFDTAPAGRLIYYSYYHEPEPLVESGAFTLTQYKAAWTHIAAIAAGAHNPCLKATLILMSWDLNPAAKVDWRAYLPAGHVITNLTWDAYPAGTVHDSNPQPTPAAQFMGSAEAASRSVGLPYGFAEFALGTAKGRPQWLTQVAAYLKRTHATYGILFDSTGYPWMYLRDKASIAAWRSAVAGSS